MADFRPPGEVRELLRRIPILMYHKIERRKEIGINVVSPEQFRRHITLIRQLEYQPVTFRDLLTKPSLPDKPLIITFDDAYESIYQNAFPILREFGFRGVVFVIGGFIGEWNRWDANLGGICFRHMSREQLCEIEKAGWEIGAHGITHRAFPYLSRNSLVSEIRESRQILEQLSAQPVVSLAYPFGMHNAAVRRAVKEAGFLFGCKGIRGGGKEIDLLQLRRIPVYQFEGLRAFQRKLNPARLSHYEKIKLSLLSWPAIFTPLYQRLFKGELFLEN